MYITCNQVCKSIILSAEKWVLKLNDISNS